jgi:hypothetical protein
MLANFAWPRVCCNPKPNQTGGLLHIGLFNGVPILWTVFGFIVVVGAIYYLVVQRNKPFTPVRPPGEESAGQATGVPGS